MGNPHNAGFPIFFLLIPFLYTFVGILSLVYKYWTMKKRIKKTEWVLVLASIISATSFLYVNTSGGDLDRFKNRHDLFQEASNEVPSVVLPDTERIKRLIQVIQQWMPQQRI
jgi:hypothetical protein